MRKSIESQSSKLSKDDNREKFSIEILKYKLDNIYQELKQELEKNTLWAKEEKTDDDFIKWQETDKQKNSDDWENTISNYLEKESLKGGELYQKFPIKILEQQESGEVRWQIVDFGDFNIILGKKYNEERFVRLDVVRGDNKYDLADRVPKDHTLLSHPLLIGGHAAEKREVHIPDADSKSAILTILHEIGHARRYSALSIEKQKAINNAYQNQLKNTFSSEEHELMFSHEKEAWEEAIIMFKEIESQLDIQIIQDEEAIASQIQERLKSYTKYDLDINQETRLVYGSLNSNHADFLNNLKHPLRVNGNINLRGCTSLTHLLEKLSVGNTLDLEDCTALVGLPKNLYVGGEMYLVGCTSLTHLPENLSARGNLDLVGCTSLTHLPENLSVGGYLGLARCTSLNSLPENLSVGRDGLGLMGCTSLTHLPENFSVKGGMNLRGCINIKKIPKNIYELVEGEIINIPKEIRHLFPKE